MNGGSWKETAQKQGDDIWQLRRPVLWPRGRFEANAEIYSAARSPEDWSLRGQSRARLSLGEVWVSVFLVAICNHLSYLRFRGFGICSCKFIWYYIASDCNLSEGYAIFIHPYTVSFGFVRLFFSSTYVECLLFSRPWSCLSSLLDFHYLDPLGKTTAVVFAVSLNTLLENTKV